ncbi:hypothetical protein RJ639_028134 [Escallonia herrerae]|uniref:WIYLD domain-containing protein n=1 Tax=Escallonia herrerae TaxID=1293975 RepID=A0AA88XAJ4_9ASTE|nr:hypothetical protein RJ639_028134 [Escallonia herrerae]
MARDSKVAKACKAMKIYGISEETVKPVLKNLLNVFDNNWKFIEDDDYRALIDAIFDREDPKKRVLILRAPPPSSGKEWKHETARIQRDR